MICVNYFGNKFMADDIFIIEEDKVDTFDIFPSVDSCRQAGRLVFWQVDLSNIAGNDELSVAAHTCEEHFKLGDGSVLGFIKDDEGVVEGTSAHKGQGCYFYCAVFEIALQFGLWEHNTQSVI